MYCKFPKGYFFEVEKSKNLVQFELIEEREFCRNEQEKTESIELEISEIFEFSCDIKEDEKPKIIEQKVEKKKEEHKEKCNYKEKCNCENKFFEVCDNEYVGHMKEKKHSEKKCGCKKK